MGTFYSGNDIPKIVDFYLNNVNDLVGYLYAEVGKVKFVSYENFCDSNLAECFLQPICHNRRNILRHFCPRKRQGGFSSTCVQPPPSCAFRRLLEIPSFRVPHDAFSTFIRIKVSRSFDCLRLELLRCRCHNTRTQANNTCVEGIVAGRV